MFQVLPSFSSTLTLPEKYRFTASDLLMKVKASPLEPARTFLPEATSSSAVFQPEVRPVLRLVAM